MRHDFSKKHDEHLTRKVQVVVMAFEYGSWWQLLLQVNKKRGNFWQNVTGGVKHNESFEHAAKRELWEETELKPEHFFELDFECHFQDRHKRMVYERAFLAAFTSSAHPIFSKEHQSFFWKKIDSVQGQDFGHASNYGAFLKAIKELYKIE